jgi:hypothetical protein
MTLEDKKAAVVEEDSQQAFNREKRRVLAGSQKLQTGWRDIVAKFTLEDRCIVEGRQNALWHPGNVIYLDIYQSLGPKDIFEGSVPRPQDVLPHKSLSVALNALRFRLSHYGAVLSPSFHAGVTHVILDPFDMTRFQDLRERRENLKSLPEHVFEKRFVKASWVERLISEGMYLEPLESEIQILQ